MCIRQLSVKFSVISQFSGKCECVLIIKKEPSMAWNSPSWALLWRIQSNLSTTAILDTNKSGRWRNVAVIFLQGYNIVLKREMPVLAFKYITFLKHIKKNRCQTQTETNNARYRSSLWSFTIKMARRSVYTIRQSLINWPLSAIFNWQLGRVLMAVAAVER